MEYREDATGSTDLGKIIVCCWGKSEISLPFLCSAHCHIFMMNILFAVPLASGYQVGLQWCLWTNNYICVNWHSCTISLYAICGSYPHKEGSSWKTTKSQIKIMGDDGSWISQSQKAIK